MFIIHNQYLRVLLLLLVSISTISADSAGKFKVIREWKYLNFTWDDARVLETAVQKRTYVPENNIIAGVKYYDGWYYLTLPRYKSGVPATLTRIPARLDERDGMKNTAPLLEPFPNWKMNEPLDCNALQNVQNIEIDSRGQMWIIDSGKKETLEKNTMYSSTCPPKLMIFDLRLNLTTTVFSFPQDVANTGSYLYDIVVDSSDGGYAYITDNSYADPGIIVYSLKDNKAWKIRDQNSMTADPLASTFRIGNDEMNQKINLAGIALGPSTHQHSEDASIHLEEDRDVYFSPLSSLHLYSIKAKSLKNSNFYSGDQRDRKPLPIGTVTDLGVKQSQSNCMLMDNKGILYYNLLSSNGVGMWDSHTPFRDNQKLLTQDENYLQWVNSMTFEENGNLTVLTNKLHKFIRGNMDINEPNFRLITGRVDSQGNRQDGYNNYDTQRNGQTHQGGQNYNNDQNRNGQNYDQNGQTYNGQPRYTNQNQAYGQSNVPYGQEPHQNGQQPGQNGQQGNFNYKLPSNQDHDFNPSTNMNTQHVWGSTIKPNFGYDDMNSGGRSGQPTERWGQNRGQTVGQNGGLNGGLNNGQNGGLNGGLNGGQHEGHTVGQYGEQNGGQYSSGSTFGSSRYPENHATTGNAGGSRISSSNYPPSETNEVLPSRFGEHGHASASQIMSSAAFLLFSVVFFL